MNTRDWVVLAQGVTFFALLAVLVTTLRIRNGLTWRLYKAVNFFYMIAAFGAWMIVLNKPIAWAPDVNTVLVVTGRMCGSIINLILAYAMWTKTRNQQRGGGQ